MEYNFKLGDDFVLGVEAKPMIWLQENICPQCGKIFFPVPNQWAYKVRGVNVCSYGCKRKGDKRK